MRAKAPPLQALGTNTPRQLAYRFDDEFEDEKFLADLLDVEPQLHKGNPVVRTSGRSSSELYTRSESKWLSTPLYPWTVISSVFVTFVIFPYCAGRIGQHPLTRAVAHSDCIKTTTS